MIDQALPSPMPLNLATLEPIGPIVRLQVQVAPLKQGDKPHRWYDPSPITSVPRLRIDDGGVAGLAGDDVLGDVHHRDHPLSRYRGENGISLGLTAHYTIMRNAFGDHLTDGIAGENILIAADRVYVESDFAGGVVIVTDRGPVEIGGIEVAAPCVEFGKFVLRLPRERTADREVAAAVTFLHEGIRGFYATGILGDDTPHISLGDLAYRRRDA